MVQVQPQGVREEAGVEAHVPSLMMNCVSAKQAVYEVQPLDVAQPAVAAQSSLLALEPLQIRHRGEAEPEAAASSVQPVGKAFRHSSSVAYRCRLVWQRLACPWV